MQSDALNRKDTTHIALHDFREILGLMLDSASAIVAIKDLGQRYVYANREMEIAFGVDPGELIGSTVERWVGSDSSSGMMSRDVDVIKGGRAIRTTEKVLVGDREFLWAVTRFPLRDEDGRIVGTGLVGIIIDGHDAGASAAGADEAVDRARRHVAELNWAVAKIKDLATKDSRTGVWNRSRIEEEAANEMARLERFGHPVSLAVISLDGIDTAIKDFDEGAIADAEREFCSVVKSCLRSTDQIGRWEDHVFFALLPNTSGLSARLVIERARRAVQRHAFQKGRHLTMSAGIAACGLREDLRSWIDRALDVHSVVSRRGGDGVEVDMFGVNTTERSEPGEQNFARLLWRKAYECGDPILDAEHREMFDSCNAVLSMFLRGASPEQVSPEMDRMHECVLQHFRDEEAVLAASGYAEAQAHAQIHRELLDQARFLRDRYESGEISLGTLFNYIAYDMVFKHLMVEDRKYFAVVAAYNEKLRAN